MLTIFFLGVCDDGQASLHIFAVVYFVRVPAIKIAQFLAAGCHLPKRFIRINEPVEISKTEREHKVGTAVTLRPGTFGPGFGGRGYQLCIHKFPRRAPAVTHNSPNVLAQLPPAKCTHTILQQIYRSNSMSWTRLYGELSSPCPSTPFDTQVAKFYTNC